MVDFFISSSLSKVNFWSGKEIKNPKLTFRVFCCGEIKSLIGLEKNDDTNYVKSKRIPIDIPIEPGSLIKPFNLMSLLEDNKADTSSVYDTKGGKISYFGSYIKDRKTGYNKLSLRNAFLINSNTIFAQAIDSAYKNNPQPYIDNFQKFGLSTSFL